jgi:hypothetical protein
LVHTDAHLPSCVLTAPNGWPVLEIEIIFEICLFIPNPSILKSNAEIYVHMNRLRKDLQTRRVLLPTIRTIVTAIWNCLVGASLPVATLLVDFGPPPFEVVHPTGEDEPKKHDD